MKNIIILTRILVFFIINFIQGPLFSQKNENQLIYVFERKMIFYENILRDTLILNSDSTFKFIGNYNNMGIHKKRSEGTYSKIDSIIILNSYEKFKKEINVIERKSYKKCITYKHNFKKPYVVGGSPFIVELDENFNQYSDTVFFTYGIFENTSKNKNVKGFILYDGSEYVQKYIFKKNRSNYIKIGLYPFDDSNLYFKDEILLLRGKDLILKYLNNELIFKNVIFLQ